MIKIFEVPNLAHPLLQPQLSLNSTFSKFFKMVSRIFFPLKNVAAFQVIMQQLFEHHLLHIFFIFRLLLCSTFLQAKALKRNNKVRKNGNKFKRIFSEFLFRFHKFWFLEGQIVSVHLHSKWLKNTWHHSWAIR